MHESNKSKDETEWLNLMFRKRNKTDRKIRVKKIIICAINGRLTNDVRIMPRMNNRVNFINGKSFKLINLLTHP